MGKRCFLWRETEDSSALGDCQTGCVRNVKSLRSKDLGYIENKAGTATVRYFVLFDGIAKEVGYGEEAAGFFANFPGVAVGMNSGDHFAELACGIGAETGDYAVVKQDEGNQWEDVSPEETGKAERTDERRGYKAAEKHQSHLRDSDRMAASAFENSDSLAMVHRVLQNADSLRLWKMMEGTENRAEPGESCGDFRGINRFRPVGYRAMRFFFYALECGGVRVDRKSVV